MTTERADKFIDDLSKMDREQITDFLLKKGNIKPIIPFILRDDPDNKKLSDKQMK